MKTNKPSSIPSLHCCLVPLKGRRAFLLVVSSGGVRAGGREGKEGRTATEWKKRGKKIAKIYLSRGGGGGVAEAAAAVLQNS